MQKKMNNSNCSKILFVITMMILFVADVCISINIYREYGIMLCFLSDLSFLFLILMYFKICCNDNREDLHAS
jgi:hypothetical protein